MHDKWYSKLISKVKDVYIDRIIVHDQDALGGCEEIREELSGDFALHTYTSEIVCGLLSV